MTVFPNGNVCILSSSWMSGQPHCWGHRRYLSWGPTAHRAATAGVSLRELWAWCLQGEDTARSLLWAERGWVRGQWDPPFPSGYNNESIGLETILAATTQQLIEKPTTNSSTSRPSWSRCRERGQGERGQALKLLASPKLLGQRSCAQGQEIWNDLRLVLVTWLDHEIVDHNEFHRTDRGLTPSWFLPLVEGKIKLFQVCPSLKWCFFLKPVSEPWGVWGQEHR